MTAERRVWLAGQRLTLPALRQDVQTLTRFGVESTVARTRWMLGSKRRRVFLRDHGRLLPKPGPLPQMSQTAATAELPRIEERTPPAPGHRGAHREWATTKAYRNGGAASKSGWQSTGVCPDTLLQ